MKQSLLNKGHHSLAASHFLKTKESLLSTLMGNQFGIHSQAALGSQIADKESRHLLFIGDGSLQLTVQERKLQVQVSQPSSSHMNSYS